MGSEIFNLKSLYLEDTVVRGARINTKNASSTRSLEVNPGESPVVKTGETGINKDYLIQSSLIGNDLNGFGTFVQNSDVVRGYTGAQNLLHGDRIRLDGDRTDYTITGLQGTDVFIVEKYNKESVSDPDVKIGACSIEKVNLDSVTYEYANENIFYNIDKSSWGITGIQVSDPIKAPSDSFEFDTGMILKFQKGTSVKKPDISTVLSTYKTLINNNTSPVFDVSLSPLPYPHSSLQVFMGKNGEELKKSIEAEDYIVNYTNGSDILYPIPPYEEREVAYIKFVDKMVDEVQVQSIDASFGGNMVINKNIQDGNTVVVRPVQDILSTDDFSIKVGGIDKVKNSEYISNSNAGMVTFVEHSNREELIDTLTYPKKLIWDGISVIKGIKEKDVVNVTNLVIPGVSGLKGIGYTIYFEDTDANNLVRDIDFIVDPESGAFSLTTPTKKDEAVLVSYYVEGEDIIDEKIEIGTMRLDSYPLIVSSLVVTKKFSTLSDSGATITKTRVLVENIDFKVSYVTGHIELLPSNEFTVELKASYTPMAQINCIAQSMGDNSNYRYTIIDDVFTYTQDDIGSKNLVFKVNNPIISIPKKILFDSDKIKGNYTFSGSILPEDILEIKVKDTDKVFNIANATYDDIKKIIKLVSSVNSFAPVKEDIVVGSYGFESDILPYAPVSLIYTIVNSGEDSFVIEGYDKTDILKNGTVLKISNKDPQSTNFYVIKEVSYKNQSTTVSIYNTFSETIIDPLFSVFDDQIIWVSMSEDVIVDSTIPIDSEFIVLNGGTLFIKTNIKKDALLLVNSQEVYTITSVVIGGNQAIIGIYPNLRSPLTSNITFSRLPVYDAGITSLPASKIILDDVSQPAFSLWYQSPEGFEGSAKILYTKEKITIDEYISGVKNPISYEYFVNNYIDIYTLAKAIQATVSTFKKNVPDIGIPDYSPFTITHANREEYYLGNGVWSPNTLIPFEEEVFVNLPYTFTVIPELFKYTLIELFSGKKGLTVKGSDVTNVLTIGMVLAFINKISGTYFFSRISKIDFSTDTIVTLSSTITENMVAPYMYVCTPPVWIDFSNQMLSIDYNVSMISFSGTISQNVRVGTLLIIGEKDVYQVQRITQNNGSFNLFLNSEIDRAMSLQFYTGYVKISADPFVLSTPSPQPYVQMTYSVPVKHTGVAYVKIDLDQIAFKEIIDNFNIKETILKYVDFDNFGLLFEAIKSIESYVSGYKPFSISVDSNFSDVPIDTFDKYALKNTGGQYMPLPDFIALAVSAFYINYKIPSGYGGFFSIKVKSDYIAIKESVFDSYANELEKETIIYYGNTLDLYDLVNNYIPNISSIVSESIYPFSAQIKNMDTFGLGKWSDTHLVPLLDEYAINNPIIYGILDASYFSQIININETKMEIDTDYTIDNGSIELINPVESLDRYLLNYMGLDNLFENEEESITCSCKFLTELPVGYRLDVYLEYKNIDQFYIQKLTERKFTEIVTVPQIEELVEQKGSAGGQGNDSGASSNFTPVYSGGIVDLNYLLRDEYIKKQLYQRFYKWYKQRLRGLSAELQLGLGFKIGHSNSVGDVNGYYSLEDQYVETEDYTLTTDQDLEQIDNGYSKFFPLEYEDSAPDYYHRFSKENLSFNEVYCCNITYRNDKNKIITVGIVKSDRPYWNKIADLVFKVWEDKYINKNLIGSYNVDVPLTDRSFAPSNYTFLRVVDIGDKIKVDKFKNYYTISDIVSPSGKSYEYIVLNIPFTDRGIKTYNIVDNNNAPFDTLIENLPPDGYRIWINRQDKEDFPMFDDFGSLGATAYGESIEGLSQDGRRIKKPFLTNLLRLFFPWSSSIEPTTNFKVMVKKDSEASWEELGTIDLTKLTFKEERNIDDVLDALRFDFKEKYTVPVVPPYIVYDIKEDSNQGFFRYFYLSLEKVYDANSPPGYYQSIVLRAKDRNWWFKIVNGGEDPIIGDYGFSEEKIYENFYDPDNIYKRLLLEKQAWQTEELIVRDLYDYNDKLARAFEQGDLNRKNSKYQNYLAMPDGGIIQGISDILRIRIPGYEKQLRFLIDSSGPVFRTLYPDFIHAEDSASPEIATTYKQTLFAWNLYNSFYSKLNFYYTLNENNNYVWKNDYVRWALSAEPGTMFQGMAKQMYERDTRVLTIGLQETPTIKVSLAPQSIYTIVNPTILISSNYEGKYLQISFNLLNKDTPAQDTQNIVHIFPLYLKSTIGGVQAIAYKTISEVCSDIFTYSYEGVHLFVALDVFLYYENDIVSKISYVTNQSIDPVNGIQLLSTNVADHRVSDPRILFINRNIEDRIYTHGVRELPGFSMSYLGNYYLLRYGTPGLTVSLYYHKENFRYGVFFDDVGEKSLTIAYDEEDKTIYNIFKLYNKNGEVYEYKTLYELASEISQSYDFSASTVFDVRDLLCDTLIVTSDYITSGTTTITPYITTNEAYSNLSREVNQFFYRVYKDNIGLKKIDIIFYNIIVDGKRVYWDKSVSDTFIFSFQKIDNTFKTIAEICVELNSFKYRGENILSAISKYVADPKSALSTIFVLDTINTPVGYDWKTSIYVDTYMGTISGVDANSRSISNIKNAIFSFPMYTASGNSNKTAIEGIPVSGTWEAPNSIEVMEISCIDGFEWSVYFSDFESGDYKSYKTPPDIIDIIDRGEPLSEAQYNQISTVEDRPVVAVLKELVLTKISTFGNSTIRFNLRKYASLNDLIEAIVLSRFNGDGIPDANGSMAFFSAKLIGDKEIEGKYKSSELDTVYVPIIKTFTVNMDDGTVLYKSNQLIGWELTNVILPASSKHQIKMSEKRYSYSPSHKFIVNSPDRAYVDTLYNNPQGLRRDILAFDLYSWDYNAHYEVRDNWIYFKSDNIDYTMAGDLGQPLKTLGYGIPLSGSGHPMTQSRESILSLVNRINGNTIVSKWFYANLKFTRDNKDNPGYFEYNYLPNYYLEIPRSFTDNIMLRDDPVISVRPVSGYTFSSSSITIDDMADSMSISCDWHYDYEYERVFFFNDVANRVIDGLAYSINHALAPEIPGSLIEATFDPGLTGSMSKNILPSFVEKTLDTTGIDLKMHVGIHSVTAINIKVRNESGVNFTISKATYIIPKNRDRLIIKCRMTYHSTYSLIGYNFGTINLLSLSEYLSSIRPYPDNIFTPLISSVVLSDSFNDYSAERLLSTTNTINITGTPLLARLNDITAFKVLNMTPEGTLNITDSIFDLVTFKTYQKEIPPDNSIHDLIDSIRGNYIEGLLSCDVLPIKITSKTYGRLNAQLYSLVSNNTPAHVYFGILGDIRFVQISDHNLHIQYNYIKERLGMPWADASGNLDYDYYTPETFNDNNPCAIDTKNFLGYLRTGRYNQIKNSVIKEAIISNKYLWLYMKFHKEFGCDQRANMLKKTIDKGNTDIGTLNQII
jgi:hypothetical protein